MKFLLLNALSLLSIVSLVESFSSPPSKPCFAIRKSALGLADYDLDYGMNNDYETAPGADGGQGEFGAISPNNWRLPGTSPVGQSSYPGADDGGDEPWFSEAVSTVSLDLKKAEDTLMAFTKEAAMFKIDQFIATKPHEFTTKEACYEELVGKLGYNAFLESSEKVLAKEWKKLHPEAKKEKKEKKEAGDKDAPKKKAGDKKAPAKKAGDKKAADKKAPAKKAPAKKSDEKSEKRAPAAKTPSKE